MRLLTTVAWRCSGQGWSCALFVFQVMGVVGPSSVADGLPLLHLSPYLSPPLPFSTAVVRLVALQIQVWLSYLFVTLVKSCWLRRQIMVFSFLLQRLGKICETKLGTSPNFDRFGASALSAALSCTSVILLEISKIAESLSSAMTSVSPSVI